MPYPTTYLPEAADTAAVDLAGRPCPRLSTPGEVARRLASLDEQYVRAEFVPLRELLGRRSDGEQLLMHVVAGRLPQPAYRLDDGSDWVPGDYCDLLDDAGSVAALEPLFAERYEAAARRYSVPASASAVGAQWADFLGGGYHVCLRRATPEDIALKAALITGMDGLLEDPRPADPVWRAALRRGVEGLGAIERPGAALDQPRWGGPMSPQWYGTYVRTTYPAAFG